MWGEARSSKNETWNKIKRGVKFKSFGSYNHVLNINREFDEHWPRAVLFFVIIQNESMIVILICNRYYLYFNTTKLMFPNFYLSLRYNML